MTRAGRKFLARTALVVVLFALTGLIYFLAVFYQVSKQARIDEAQRADVIVVLGAAQYWGRPSPVLKARLDHALALFRRDLAPRIIATGGHGPGAKFTESEVSRDYLSENGIPAEYITVETAGRSTMESAAAVAEIMDRMQLDSCIVVSDDYHIHRAKKMLEERGFQVFGSPRRTRLNDPWARRKRLAKESLSYILWRIGLRV